MLYANLSSFLSVRTFLLPAALACALVLVGCDDDPVSPEPEPDPDPEVTASFTIAPASPEVGEEVTLDGSSSSGENTGALSFDWTLTPPDGSNAVVDDPSAETTTFEADVEGTYDVALEVSADGAIDTATEAIDAETSLSIVEISDDITADRTLYSDTLYVVTDEVDLRALLTVEPGTTIEFENDTGFELRSSGGLVADGTESDPILMTGTEETPGSWNGIFVRSSENDDNLLNWVTVEYGGGEDFTGAAPGNVVVGHGTNSASISITNSTMRQSGSDGLWVRSNGDLPNFEGNTLTQNEQAPAAVGYNNVHLLGDGSTYTGNSEEYVYARSGDTIEDTDVQWDNLDVPYRVGTSEIEVRDVDFVIAPGTTLEFEEDSHVELRSNSALIADGNEAAPILFTGTEETPGWWNGIYVRSSQNPDNVLNHVTVEYGGGDDFVGAESGNVVVATGGSDGASVSITNSVLRHSATDGLWVRRNGDLSSFQNNILTSNGAAPVGIGYNKVHQLDSGSNYTGNTNDYVVARDRIAQLDSENVTWERLNVPYRIETRTVEIQDITLTIAPGTTLEFEEDTGIELGTDGGLVADGTEEEPILFTGTTETVGWWNGIFVESRNSDNLLDWVTVEYGGGDDFVGAPAGDVIIGSGANEGEMNVTNSVLRTSAEYGVWVHGDSDANTDICGVNSFENNAEADCEVN